VSMPMGPDPASGKGPGSQWVSKSSIEAENKVFFEAYQSGQISKSQYDAAMAVQAQREAELAPKQEPKSQFGKDYTQSVVFYQGLMYPEYGGVYAVPDVPGGFEVAKIDEVQAGAPGPLGPDPAGMVSPSGQEGSSLKFTLMPKIDKVYTNTSYFGTIDTRPPTAAEKADLRQRYLAGENIFMSAEEKAFTGLGLALIPAPVLTAPSLVAGAAYAGGALVGVGVGEGVTWSLSGRHLSVPEAVAWAAGGQMAAGAGLALGRSGFVQSKIKSYSVRAQEKLLYDRVVGSVNSRRVGGVSSEAVGSKSWINQLKSRFDPKFAERAAFREVSKGRESFAVSKFDKGSKSFKLSGDRGVGQGQVLVQKTLYRAKVKTSPKKFLKTLDLSVKNVRSGAVKLVPEKAVSVKGMLKKVGVKVPGAVAKPGVKSVSSIKTKGVSRMQTDFVSSQSVERALSPFTKFAGKSYYAQRVRSRVEDEDVYVSYPGFAVSRGVGSWAFSGLGVFESVGARYSALSGQVPFSGQTPIQISGQTPFQTPVEVPIEVMSFKPILRTKGKSAFDFDFSLFLRRRRSKVAEGVGRVPRLYPILTGAQILSATKNLKVYSDVKDYLNVK